MTKRKRTFCASLLLLLALACAPRARAQSGAQSPPQPTPAAAAQDEQTQQPNQGQLELVRALNLTPEQRARIAQIRQETEEQTRQITFRLRRARRALEQAIYAERADEALIQQRTKEVADAEAARVEMRADAELKVRRALTPEQFATFRALRRQAQLARQRQNASDSDAAPKAAARLRQRSPTRANGNPSAVPSLFPRRPRQPNLNRRAPARP